ncbi:MAG: hypothetical protein R3D33_00460 [Hyphomicrobiaceae bacterium]
MTIGPVDTAMATAAGSVRSGRANSAARFWLVRDGRHVAGTQMAGDVGQENDADGDADDAERELSRCGRRSRGTTPRHLCIEAIIVPIID